MSNNSNQSQVLLPPKPRMLILSGAIAHGVLEVHPAFELPEYEVLSYWNCLSYLGLGLLASLVAYIYTQEIKLAQAAFRGEIPLIRLNVKSR